MRAVPDGTKRLSDGVIVEASVLARVFGIRLLTLHADVVIAPAETVAAPHRQYGHDGSTAPPLEARSLPSAPSRAVGGGLADAVRLIDEGAASLAATRAARDRR